MATRGVLAYRDKLNRLTLTLDDDRSCEGSKNWLQFMVPLFHTMTGGSIGKMGGGTKDFPYMKKAGRFQTRPPCWRSGLVTLTRFRRERIAGWNLHDPANVCLYS